MKTLLRIDASMRSEGSSSRGLADHFESKWVAANRGARVFRRDLANDPPPHLDLEAFTAFTAPEGGARSVSDVLVEEFLSADELLIASPLYNFGLPSPLKAYFDQIVPAGKTFARTERGYVGLAGGRRAHLLTVRGGPDGSDDFQTPYLKAILAFIGITEVEHVALERTAFGEAICAENTARARLQIDHLFAR